MKTVLVVDDDRYCRLNIIAFLEDSGFIVVGEGTNGKEAFEKYCSLRPDLVIMDLLMPNYSGFEGLQWIKEHDRMSKVVIMSGDHSVMTREQARAKGSDMYITKPVDLDLLERILNDLQGGFSK